MAGAAFGYQFPEKGPLKALDFSGGEATVASVLSGLGFKVVKVGDRGGSGRQPFDAESSEPLMDPNEAGAERALRLEVWSQLVAEGADSAQRSRLRQLGIYGGQQGIWVDKARTGGLTPDGVGIAVAVLHTGASYPDDLSDDGLRYHYPSTERLGTRDAGEIEALKRALRLTSRFSQSPAQPVSVLADG